MYHRAAAAAVLAVGLAIPAEVSASPLFELVGDPGGEGGLTARINADGPAAAYFNPALLAGAQAGFDLGVFFLVSQIGIVVDGRGTSPVCEDGACDVPEVDDRGPESFRHEGTSDRISDPTIPTSWLEDGHDSLTARPRQAAGSGKQSRAYQTIGLVAPIFRGRLTLGLFAMIPLGEFATANAYYNDEREQYFSNSLHPELYGDRLTATSLAFGSGLRLRDDLSVGATFTLSLANEAAAPVYVSNLNDLQTVLLDSDIAVKAAVAPHFGLAWSPVPRARVALTVHTPQAFRISTGFNYTLATGSEQSTTLKFTHSYMPLTIAAGGSYRLGGGDEAGGVALTGLVTWARWSQYRDRHDVQPGGEYPWASTLSAAVGVRYDAGATRARLDATYQPTPVPPQTGRSNYVDSDRLGVSAGLQRDFTLWGTRFHAGIDAVGHRIFKQHVTKFIGDGVDTNYVIDEVPDDSIDVGGDAVPGREGLQTNNPGFPGFGSSGWIFGGGVRVSIEY